MMMEKTRQMSTSIVIALLTSQTLSFRYPVRSMKSPAYSSWLARPTLALQASKNEEEGEDDDDDDDDDETTQTAYGNRSLAWTNRYRKLIPYEDARRRAMELGLNTKEEWEELRRDGKCYHGPYLVSRPDEMYQEEWISWEEFLGAMRSFDEAREIVRNVLHLSSMEEYHAFVNNDPKRAEGLRIPAKPEVFYKDKGWKGPDHFFGVFS